MIFPACKHCGWIVLFRFGMKDQLEKFRKHGLLYMKPSSYFSDLERGSLGTDVVRPDRFEGTDSIHNPRHIQRLIIEGPIALNAGGQPINAKIDVPPNELADHVAVSLNDHACNIFCMYATISPEPVDDRNFGFGDSFVFILNTVEFLRRFRNSSSREHLKFNSGLVNYYRLDEYSGTTGPFRKPDQYAYQNEFRLIVRPCNADHRELYLGNLEDITSDILPLPKINQIFDFSPEAARKAGLSW